MGMIAIKIPQDISDALSKISVPGKKLSNEELHITLFYFEKKLSINDIINITHCLYDITKNAETFKIKMNNISTFNKGPDGVPIIIPIVSEELSDLRKRLAKKLDSKEVVYSKKWPEFKPHMTLSYSTKEMEDRSLEKKLNWKVEEIAFYSGEDMENCLQVLVPLNLGKKASKFDKLCIASDIFVSQCKLL